MNEEALSADDLEESSPQDSSAVPRWLLEELTGRGVGRRAAKALLNELPEGDEALRLLEWADAEISRKKPSNPAGFLIHLIREKVTPPGDFLSSRQLREVQEREQTNREEQEKRARIHDEYQSFVRDQVDARLREHSKTEYQERLERKKEELVKKYAVLASSPARTLEETAERKLREEFQKEMPLPRRNSSPSVVKPSRTKTPTRTPERPPALASLSGAPPSGFSCRSNLFHRERNSFSAANCRGKSAVVFGEE